MDLTIVLVFALVFLVTYIITRRKYKLPPGPYSLPIVGSISLMKKLRGNQRPAEVFLNESQKYGPIMSFKLGQQLIVVLSGYDAVHEALVTQSNDFSDRPTHLPAIQSFRGPNKDEKGILFNTYGHSWKILRRFTLQTLRGFGVGKDSIEEKVFLEIDAVSKGFGDLKGQPVDFNYYMQNLVGNIVFGIIFENRYAFDDPEFENVRNLTNVAVSGAGPVSIDNFFPKFIVDLLSKKDPVQREKRDANFQKMRSFIEGLIKQHEVTFDDNNIRDFVDLYIQMTQGEGGKEKDVFTQSNMFRVILDLFLAGSETTSTTLDWGMLFMTEFPEIQKKCQKEIEEVFGDKPVQYADRGQLTYVEATIMEIQRLSNIVPLNVAHCTTRDTTLGGYDIPIRTMVFPSLYSVSMDTKYWDNPTKFNPGRFIDKTGKLMKVDAQIPFSTGPRMCLGEPLARMELFLVFTNLLQRFTFVRENPKLKHSLQAKLNQITNAPEPYKLRVIKR